MGKARTIISIIVSLRQLFPSHSTTTHTPTCAHTNTPDITDAVYSLWSLVTSANSLNASEADLSKGEDSVSNCVCALAGMRDTEQTGNVSRKLPAAEKRSKERSV